MKIGEACKHLGIVSSTLRKWEKEKLIPEPDRTPIGNREYTAEDILKIAAVVQERNRSKKQ